MESLLAKIYIAFHDLLCIGLVCLKFFLVFFFFYSHTEIKFKFNIRALVFPESPQSHYTLLNLAMEVGAKTPASGMTEHLPG